MSGAVPRRRRCGCMDGALSLSTGVAPGQKRPAPLMQSRCACVLWWRRLLLRGEPDVCTACCVSTAVSRRRRCGCMDGALPLSTGVAPGQKRPAPLMQSRCACVPWWRRLLLRGESVVCVAIACGPQQIAANRLLCCSRVRGQPPSG